MSLLNLYLQIRPKSGQSNVFFFCFASFESPKTYQIAKEKTNTQTKEKHPCRYFDTV
jgi:hypothetical protein